MPAQSNALDILKDHLSRYRQIKITVTGRKSGRAISHAIWFVFEGGVLYLLPVKGSDTQWYKNLLKNSKMQVDARDAEVEVHANAITDANEVAAVVERFQQKYGAGDVKKYYSKFDVAVIARLT